MHVLWKRWCLVAALLSLLPGAPASAQFWRVPHLGYVYPAGGQPGTTVTVTLGGQFLDKAELVHVVGDGVSATLGEYERPMTQKEFQALRDKLDEVRKQFEAARKENPRLPRDAFQKLVEEAGITPRQRSAMEEYRRQRNDPRAQANPQIAERITVTLQLASDALPGRRELRLLTPQGLSNPIWFEVTEIPQTPELEPNDADAQPVEIAGPTLVINGQILPGDVDQFTFTVPAGEQWVVRCQARELMPYLADAVPGWFQPTLTLLDHTGQQVAFVDDFRGNPDPLLAWRAEQAEQYTLRIQDAIFRGREDFVYRLTVGRLPLATGVFPPGGQVGVATPVVLSGWNLPTPAVTLEPFAAAGVQELNLPGVNGKLLFAVTPWACWVEKEPNNAAKQSMAINLNVALHGRIDAPDDEDWYSFSGKAGMSGVAEVLARRLGSPLDGRLTLLDPRGETLAGNDDCVDPAQGLMTHHADPYLRATLPRDGAYRLIVSDSQRHGGAEYSYQLTLRQPHPDFELRVTPATLNADRNGHVPITVQAIRRDGFAGPIDLQLVDAPAGFALSGATIPAGQDSLRLTLQTPAKPESAIIPLTLRGVALLEEQTLERIALPAEDMMQAFFYRHLVPTEQWLVSLSKRTAPSVAVKTPLPLTLHPGGTTPVATQLPKWVIDRAELELADPPKGVRLAEVTQQPDGPVLHVLLEPEAKVAAGNLIVEVIAKTQPGKPASRRVMGVLPALPFAVGAPALAQAD